MDLIAYSQTYRSRPPERQLEIGKCVRADTELPWPPHLMFSECFIASDGTPDSTTITIKIKGIENGSHYTVQYMGGFSK
ncbi:hypothetical protein KQ304_05385 [Synechococcus sp. CS-1329]|nr:hypothetical protein [Synechococcus sp. CS-1329]